MTESQSISLQGSPNKKSVFEVPPKKEAIKKKISLSVHGTTNKTE
jgi:hypothetical protein